MKKLITLTTATIVTASSALAGSIAYVAPEVTMIEEPTTMGGSGAWLIPLVILSLLAFTLTSSGDNDDGGQTQ